MTAGTEPRNEPLSPEEQALAQRLAQWKTGEPDTSLDRLILAQARSTVSAEAEAARPLRRPGRRPWLVGLASAATFVFAVGLIWRVAEQAPEPLAGMARQQLPADIPRGQLPAADDESAAVVFMEPPAPMEAPPPVPAPAAPAAGRDVSGGAVVDAAPSRRQREDLAGSVRKAHDIEQSVPSRPAIPAPAQPPAIATAPGPVPAPAMAPAPVAAESEAVPAPAPPAPPPPPLPDSSARSSPLPEAPAPEPPEAVSRSRASTDTASNVSGVERMDARRAVPTAPPSAADIPPADPFPADRALQRSEEPREQARMHGQDLAQAPADFRRAVERIRCLIADDEPERALAAIERLRQRHPDRDLPEDLRRFAAGRAGRGG